MLSAFKKTFKKTTIADENLQQALANFQLEVQMAFHMKLANSMFLEDGPGWGKRMRSQLERAKNYAQKLGYSDAEIARVETTALHYTEHPDEEGRLSGKDNYKGFEIKKEHWQHLINALDQVISQCETNLASETKRAEQKAGRNHKMDHS